MKLLLTLTILLNAVPGWGQESAEPPYYSEIFDGDGKIRPHYVEAYAIYKNLSEAEKADFAKKTLDAFKGDNELLPLPRIVKDGELAAIVKGVQQRGRALYAFLQDHYSAKPRYRTKKLIPGGVIDRIVARYGEQFFVGKVSPEKLAFFMGSDLIRGHDGGYRVMEDNINWVGGRGDLRLAPRPLLKILPEYGNHVKATGDPNDFYRDLVRNWRRLADPPNGKIVMWNLPEEVLGDAEAGRLAKIMAEFGVETMSPGDGKRLYADENGVTWLEKNNAEGKPFRRRVGYLFLNAEHKDFDPTWGPNRERILLNNARWMIQSYLISKKRTKLNPKADGMRKFLRQYDLRSRNKELERLQKAITPGPKGRLNVDRLQEVVENNPHGLRFNLQEYAQGKPEGISRLVMEGKLPCSFTLGTEFLKDKELYTYVEKMIRFYLGEKPLLANLPTRSFTKRDSIGRDIFDVKTWKRFREQPERFVVKPVDGRGGEGIRIGSRLSASEVESLEKEVRANHRNYLLQEFFHLSVLDRYLIDSRLHGWFGPGAEVVSRVLWGRAVPISGDGLTNLSAQGKMIATYLADDPNFVGCSKLGLGRPR